MSETPPGSPTRLKVYIRPRRAVSVPAWESGVTGLMLTRDDRNGWAVVQSVSGRILSTTRTWGGARRAATAYGAVAKRNGRAWYEDFADVTHGAVAAKEILSVARSYESA